MIQSVKKLNSRDEAGSKKFFQKALSMFHTKRKGTPQIQVQAWIQELSFRSRSVICAVYYFWISRNPSIHLIQRTTPQCSVNEGSFLFLRLPGKLGLINRPIIVSKRIEIFRSRIRSHSHSLFPETRKSFVIKQRNRFLGAKWDII